MLLKYLMSQIITHAFIGWLSPVSIRFKIIFQSLCKQKLDSDDRPFSRLWSENQEDLKLLENLKIPRFLGTDLDKNDYH